MGLFQHRPEDPTEWAGLPAEPLDEESLAERLPESPPVDTALSSLTGLFGGGAATSVVVPVTGTEDTTASLPPQSRA
jgi:hypothetical protein